MSASPTAASPNRNLFLDFAKGVLILLVVTGHSLQYAVYKDEGSWGHPFYRAIYLFHMPLFMAVSGYLARPGIERSKLVPFLTGRVQSYILPILIWSLGFGIVMMGLTHGGPKSAVSFMFHEAIGTRFWFLWALLGSLIMTIVVKAIGRRLFLPLYLLSTAAVLLLPDAGILYLFKYTYPFFQTGFLVSKHGVPEIVTRQRLPLLAISGVLTVLCYLRWTEHDYVYLGDRMSLWHGNASTVAFRFAANCVSSLFAVLAMYEIYRRWGGKGNGLLYRFGQDSIYIYIIQGYVFAILTELAIRAAFTPPAPLAGALIAIVLGIFVTWLCWWLGALLSRHHWTGRLLFGKMRKPAKPSST